MHPDLLVSTLRHPDRCLKYLPQLVTAASSYPASCLISMRQLRHVGVGASTRGC